MVAYPLKVESKKRPSKFISNEHHFLQNLFFELCVTCLIWCIVPFRHQVFHGGGITGVGSHQYIHNTPADYRWELKSACSL